MTIAPDYVSASFQAECVNAVASLIVTGGYYSCNRLLQSTGCGSAGDHGETVCIEDRAALLMAVPAK